MTESIGEWVQRDEPLLPSAVLAVGGCAPTLASAAGLLRRRGCELRAAAGPEHVLVLGQHEDLPWADGATFLGWESGILISTTHRPAVHPDLLAQALRQRLGAVDLAVAPTWVVQYVTPDGPADIAWLDAYVVGSDG